MQQHDPAHLQQVSGFTTTALPRAQLHLALELLELLELLAGLTAAPSVLPENLGDLYVHMYI